VVQAMGDRRQCAAGDVAAASRQISHVPATFVIRWKAVVRSAIAGGRGLARSSSRQEVCKAGKAWRRSILLEVFQSFSNDNYGNDIDRDQ
jgi:hypothetical protein